jgi:iron complex transport system substrate-binding protein
MKRITSVVGLAVMVLLAACGGGDDAAKSTSVPATPAGGATTVGAAGPAAAAATDTTAPAALRLLPASPADLGAPPVPDATASAAANPASYALALAPYGNFGTDAAPGVFPRTMRHAMGETTIKAAPARVVVMDTGELDAMVEVGIKPVGAVDYGVAGLPAYLSGSLDGVKVVGSINEPDIEAIAALRPDLILSSKLRHEKLYQRLSAIAPTVFTERPGVSWKQNFVLYAQSVGREREAAATVERYEQRVRELNKALPSPRPSVSVVRILGNAIRYYQRANFLGVLFTDLGLPRPPAQNVDDFGVDLGLETLGQYVPADLIVLAVFGEQNNSFAPAVLQSPLWQSIPAVKAGKVVTVDDQTWIGGIGYRAAFAVLDGFAKHFGVR